LVIWDGSPIYRSKEVRAFLANGAAKQIHLERLPAYAPDLNPDEATWQYLKRVELRNVCCFDLNHLHQQLDLAILRLRHKPYLIRSFLTAPVCTYEKVYFIMRRSVSRIVSRRTGALLN